MAEPVLLDESQTSGVENWSRFKEQQALDIQRQRGEAQVPDAKTTFDTIMSSTTVDEILASGHTSIGDVRLTPQTIGLINKNPAKKAQLWLQFQKEYKVPEMAPEQLAVGFSGPKYEELRIPDEFAGDERFEEYVRNQQETAKMLMDSNLPLRGKQIFVDDWANTYYGRPMSELGSELLNIPIEGFYQGIPTLFSMAASGTYALLAASYDSAFKNYEETFGESYTKHYNDSMQIAYGGLGGFNLKNIEESTEGNRWLANARQRTETWYKNKYIEKYGRDAWMNDHAFAEKVEVTFDEQGQASLQIVRDEKGNIVYDEKLDPAIVDGLIQSSWESLSDAQQMGVYLFGGGPFVLGNVARKVNNGVKTVNRIKTAKETDPERFMEMTDIQVFEALQEETSTRAMNAWRKSWKRIPVIGKIGAYKDEIAAGKVMLDHRQSIDYYDNRINELTAKTTELNKRSKLSPTQARELKDLETEINFLEKGRSRYVTQSGGKGAILNPYTRGAFFDEVYISGAMAYAPDIIPYETLGMSEGAAEMLVALSSPILAPYSARKLKGAAVGVARRTPFLGVGVQALEDLGTYLNSSEVLSRIGIGAIIRGDIDEIRGIAEMEGIALSDEDVQALRVFNRALNSMGDEVIDIGGVQTTIRDQVYNSLVEYGNNMRRMRQRMTRLKDQDGQPVFTDSEINQNMASMHLSLAYASGFAPFIQIQKLAAQGKSVTEIFEGGDAAELFKSIRTQDQVLRGMTTQLDILRKSLASKGLKLDSNDPINQTIVKLQQSYESGMDDLTRRKSQLNGLIDLYLQSPEAVDENLIDEIVDLRLMLMPEEVAKTINRAQLAEDTAEIILDNFKQRQVALNELATSMSPTEFKERIQKEADILFDVTLGVRKARGSARYESVNAYANENGITIGMDSVARKLADLSEDVTQVGGIAYAFGGGREFIRKGGKDLKDTFEEMAQQGLLQEFGGDYERMIESLFKGEYIKKPTATEAALFLAEEDKSADALKFFVGTVEQVEDIHRVFAYNAYLAGDAKAPGARSARMYLDEYATAIDDLISEADPSGNLSDMVDVAREGWRIDVGDPTDGAAYGGKVIRSRSRKLGMVPEGQRKYLYGNRNKPEGVFEEIGGLLADIATAADDARVDELKLRLVDAKKDLMLFYGVELDPSGSPVFDLSNPQHRKIADGLSSLLETVTNNKVGFALSSRLGPQATEAQISLLPKDLQPRVRGAAEKLLEAQKTLPQFNFKRAQDILDAEQILAMQVKNVDGSYETRLPLSTKLREQLAPVDDLLADNQQYIDVYNDIRDQVNTVGSDLRNAGEATIKKQNDSLEKLQRIAGDVQNPVKFFETHLENIDEVRFGMLKQTLGKSGMSPEEVTIALQEMYIRGLLAKSGLKTKRLAGFGGEAVADISDIEVLVDYVSDPAKRKTMEVVLGKEHAQHLEDIADWMNNASGNGAGIKAYLDVGQMRMESKIARVFNLARGMVGLDYVTAEVGFRLMMQHRQETIQFILSNRKAAGVLSKILNSPRSVTREDLKLLGMEVRSHLMLEILKSGGEIETLDQLVGDEIPIGYKDIISAGEGQELEELVKIMEEGTSNEETETNTSGQ